MKFLIYATVMMGIMILLAGAGVESPSSSIVKSFNVFNSTGDITFQNLKSSNGWDELVTLLALGATSAIIIGSFSRTSPESYLVAGLVSLITGLIAGDMIFLYQLLSSYGIDWIKWTALAIIAPLMIGLFISAISFWRGTD